MNNAFSPLADESNGSSEQMMKIVTQMSQQLETGLTGEQISIVMELLRKGANAEQLAKLVINLRRQIEQSNVNN